MNLPCIVLQAELEAQRMEEYAQSLAQAAATAPAPPIASPSRPPKPRCCCWPPSSLSPITLVCLRLATESFKVRRPLRRIAPTLPPRRKPVPNCCMPLIKLGTMRWSNRAQCEEDEKRLVGSLELLLRPRRRRRRRRRECVSSHCSTRGALWYAMRGQEHRNAQNIYVVTESSYINIIKNINNMDVPLNWCEWEQIIQIHNNVLWEWQYSTEYSPHSTLIWEYFIEYCQSRRTLLWIWIMLCLLAVLLINKQHHKTFLKIIT